MFLHLASLRDSLTAWGPDARRLRQVAAQPGIATLGDIELVMRAHGVPERLIWGVVDRLVYGDISAPLAWAFVMEYDGTELAEVLMKMSPEADLADHFDSAPPASA